MLALAFVSLATQPSSKEPPERYFALQPLGKVDDDLKEMMRRFVEVAYGRTCKVMSPVSLPSSAYDARRKQYRASELLDVLRNRFLLTRLFHPGNIKVVGMTEKDIYTRQMNFIFGLASLRGRFCVVSTCRFHQSFRRKPEDKELLYGRALKVLYHELGHTFGMRHCDKIQCAMCYHNSLTELDDGYVWFCPECTHKLEKRVGALPEDREARLAEFLKSIGLVEDAKRYTKEKGKRR